jgi:hypothetical protein
MDDGALRDRLLPGERVAWSGEPGQGFIFTAQDLFLVPFSLLWCGFAVFWTISATGEHAPSFFTLWGMMFVCFGLYFVFGRFLVDAWLRGRIRYALTDQRVLISRAGPFPNFTAIAPDRLPDARLSERSGGRGTIRFGQQPGWRTNQFAVWSPSLDPTPQFLAIADARAVFDLVQRSATPRR